MPENPAHERAAARYHALAARLGAVPMSDPARRAELLEQLAALAETCQRTDPLNPPEIAADGSERRVLQALAAVERARAAGAPLDLADAAVDRLAGALLENLADAGDDTERDRILDEVALVLWPLVEGAVMLLSHYLPTAESREGAPC